MPNNMNEEKRTLVIGDIHGNYNKLLRVLDYVGYSGNEQLIFLGDYISDKDKNNSYNVLDYLLELKKDKPDTIFLRGNHEEEILSEAAYFTNTCGINPWFFEELCLEGFYFYFDNGDIKIADSNLVMNTLSFYLQKEYLPSYSLSLSLETIKKRLAKVKDKYKKESLQIEYREIYDMFIKKFIAKKKKSFEKVIRFPRKYIEFIEQTRLIYENDQFFFSHEGNPPPRYLYDFVTKKYSRIITSDNTGEETVFDKIIVCGHWHSDFIKFKKICLALADEIQVLDITEMKIWDSKNNLFEITPDMLFRKPTCEYIDAYCWYCKDVRSHRYIKKVGRDYFVKNTYICTICNSYFKK